MPTSIQLLKQSFRLVGENPVLFFKILAIPALLSVLMAFLEPAKDTAIVSTMEWVAFIAVTIVVIVANMLMTIALVYAVADRNLSVKQAYSLAKNKFFKYLLFSIALGLITLISFLLLVIPGIIVMVWFAFASYFLLLENLSIKNSLKASRDLVKGRWWSVFWKLIVFIFFGIVISIVFALISSILSAILPPELTYLVSVVFNLLFTPIAIAYMFLMYFNLKTTRNSDPVLQS